MKFKDGTKFALGGESSMQIDEFVFGKSPEEDKVTAKVLKGAFRFITGLVEKTSRRTWVSLSGSPPPSVSAAPTSPVS